MSERFLELNSRVIACRRCPRLVRYRESFQARRAFEGQEYWRRPVPGFGDAHARIVLIGLAPAAHGGERTGRVFTGDESARFLYRSLYDAGLASQPTSESRDDGLELRDCYITAAVKCAPPANKPTALEFGNCGVYLDEEMALLDEARALVALGRMAFGAALDWAERRGLDTRGMVFRHGVTYSLGSLPRLYGCYHPSPRNTYTGLLTRRMMTDVFRKVIKECAR
jgi:uracil-DNA glycosylase family 4